MENFGFWKYEFAFFLIKHKHRVSFVEYTINVSRQKFKNIHSINLFNTEVICNETLHLRSQMAVIQLNFKNDLLFVSFVQKLNNLCRAFELD